MDRPKRQLMLELTWRHAVEVGQVPEILSGLSAASTPADVVGVDVAERVLRELHRDGLIRVEHWVVAESQARLTRQEAEKKLVNGEERVEGLDVERVKNLANEQVEMGLPQWLAEYDPAVRDRPVFFVRSNC